MSEPKVGFFGATQAEYDAETKRRELENDSRTAFNSCGPMSNPGIPQVVEKKQYVCPKCGCLQFQAGDCINVCKAVKAKPARKFKVGDAVLIVGTVVNVDDDTLVHVDGEPPYEVSFGYPGGTETMWFNNSDLIKGA
jgi:hypothetical protein